MAFAGGGAKGVVHVGALKAMENEKLELLGVAGTSAGAIIATLAAAGYSADQILHPEESTSILDDFRAADPRIRRPTDLFGGWGWWPVLLARTVHPIAPVLAITLGFVGIFLPLILLGLDHSPIPGASAVAFRSAVGWALFALFVGAVCGWALRGLARLERLNKSLRIVLQRKMFPKEPGRVVRLQDFGKDGFPALKIVAGNLTSRKLHLFSATHHGWLPVADAVCASISLPVIFKLWSGGRVRYIDGGIVSNLPAWPFDEERELHPDALTLAFDIRSSEASGRVRSWNWPAAMVQTGFFGGGQLNLRAMRRTQVFELETKLGLLSFDMSGAQIRAELREATAAARERLATRITLEPEILQTACDNIREVVDEALSRLRVGQVRTAGRVRVAIAMQDPDYSRTVRLQHQAGYDVGDPDFGGALLDLEGTRQGVAWDSWEEEIELAAGGALTCAWPNMAWRLTLPIWDRGPLRQPRQFLILIDGSESLPADGATTGVMLTLVKAITTIFETTLQRLDDTKGP